MLPTAFWATPSVPHFGHLFVGWVGAGMWTGMASTLPGSRARSRSRRIERYAIAFRSVSARSVLSQPKPPSSSGARPKWP